MKRLVFIMLVVFTTACTDDKKNKPETDAVDINEVISITKSDAQLIYDNMSNIMTLSDNPAILEAAVSTRKISRKYIYTEQVNSRSSK